MPETDAKQGSVRWFDRLSQISFNETGPHVQQLSEGDDARLVGLALRAGQEIKEHRSPSRLTVQAIDGCLLFGAAEEIRLRAGMVLQVDPGVPHHLRAETDVRLLLLMTPSPAHVHATGAS